MLLDSIIIVSLALAFIVGIPVVLLSTFSAARQTKRPQRKRSLKS